MERGVIGMEMLKARGAFSGIAEGIALVCPESIQGWSGVSDTTGKIIEKGHSQMGESVHGRILVLPCSKGSNGWSCHFNSAMKSGFKPAGWIFTQMDSRAGVATVVVGSPAVSDFEDGVDPCEIIKSGDRIRIDGTKGTVEFLEKV